ncbi:unnamed protein product [marine sediment metagenome]|uniref:Uncharacterized protein n=1 Tax=marine sediment metagenome TaxID=412755 RepID=X1ISS2_9ZZZZ
MIKQERVKAAAKVRTNFQNFLQKIKYHSNYRYIERLSKKSNNGDFSDFACNEINNLQALNLQI